MFVFLIVGIICVIGLHFTLKLIQRRGQAFARRISLWGFALGAILMIVLLMRIPMLAAILSGFLALTALLNRLLIWLPVLRFFRGHTPPANPSSPMSKEEAANILGVANDADEKEIKYAYHHLMQRCHPDTGGNEYLAQQLNQAKDTLLQSRKRGNT